MIMTRQRIYRLLSNGFHKACIWFNYHNIALTTPCYVLAGACELAADGEPFIWPKDWSI